MLWEIGDFVIYLEIFRFFRYGEVCLAVFVRKPFEKQICVVLGRDNERVGEIV